MVFCEICKLFKNTYFEEYLRTTASDLWCYSSMLLCCCFSEAVIIILRGLSILFFSLSKEVNHRCSAKKEYSEKFRKIHRKTPVSSLFIMIASSQYAARYLSCDINNFYGFLGQLLFRFRLINCFKKVLF